MKFTKLTSAALASVTFLSAVAPTAMAATTDGTVNKNTSEVSKANGGQSLPQSANTTVGITFGQADPTENSGYLRLQMVPEYLDFGTHAQALNGTYYATGDGEIKNNDTHKSYLDEGDRNTAGQDTKANMTPKFQISSAMANLKTGATAATSVQDTAWVTVVDKQDSRTPGVSAADSSGKTDEKAGSWNLDVQSAGVLKSGNTTIPDAKLVLSNTAYGQDATASEVTGQSQDNGYGAKSNEAVTPEATVALDLDGSGATNKQAVAKAAEGQGAGANVFGWHHDSANNDIQLVLNNLDAKEMGNKRFTAPITWTLSTGL